MTVGGYQEETMADERKETAPVQSEPSHKLMEDGGDYAGQELAVLFSLGERNGKPISRLATLVPSKIHRFTWSAVITWMRHEGPACKGFLITAVGIAALAALMGLVAVALLFISSSLNAALASFLAAISTVGFIMAFFFSSLTVVYLGALGFGGLTIGSIAFFSVWAVIILSGWAGIVWVIWQGLWKAFQFGRRFVPLAGSFLFSCPPVQKLSAKFNDCVVQVQDYVQGSIELHFGGKCREYFLLKKYKKTAMD